MRGQESDYRFSDFCGFLSRELSRLIAAPRQQSDASPTRGLRGRSLHIEPLEARCLMAVAAAAVNWFEVVSDSTVHAGAASWTTDSTAPVVTDSITGQTNSSNVYDWIIQFDTNSLAGITSVAQTASLLVGGGIEFDVISGLGLAGMVLARSYNASYDTVTSYLAQDTAVATYQQDALRAADAATVNDPLASQQWALSQISATRAWDLSTGSKQVVVAVIDTGVDYTHADLAANMWQNPGEIAGNGIDDDKDGFVDDVYGVDLAHNDGDPMDDNSHGTHVAGIIGAVGNNSRGVTGVDWSVSIMSVKFLNADGSGYLSDAIRAINYVTMLRSDYDVNVHVINASWGSTTFSAAMNTAIGAAGDAGILFVAAAGNSAANNDATGEYPANSTASNVISVAASTKSDTLASFSNYGATSVDLAAPGVTIYSTLPNNTYGAYSGTSMATPYVSAVAALCWAVDPDATVSEVRSAILNGVDHVGSLTGKVASGGRLNAYHTLQILQSQPAAEPTISSITASLSQAYVGTPITLTAHGVSATSSTVASVAFYQDANGNGTYDSGDRLVGSTNTISNGEASVTLNTAGYAPGTYRFFAVATDSGSRSTASAAVAVTLNVKPQNSAPALAAIADQTMGSSQYTLKVTLNASDADGDKLTYSAKVLNYDSLAVTAHTLDQQYGFSLAGKNYTTNLCGLKEKYLVDKNNNVYYLVPSGQLYRWGGTVAKSPLVAALSSVYYNNLALLYNAQAPTLTAMAGSKITASVAGNVLTINRIASYTGNFYVQVTVSDGKSIAARTFRVTIGAATSAKAAGASLNLSATQASGTTRVSSDIGLASPAPSLTTALPWSIVAANHLLATHSGGDFRFLTAETLAEGSVTPWENVLNNRPRSGASATDKPDTLAALDNAFMSMASDHSGEALSTASARAIGNNNLAPSCLDEVTTLRREVLELLRRWQSVEQDAVDGFFAESTD